jgi:hypothetical protein
MNDGSGSPESKIANPDPTAELPRAPANLLGIVFVADDFDDPLPPEIQSLFERDG